MAIVNRMSIGVLRRRRWQTERAQNRGKHTSNLNVFDLPDAAFKLHCRFSKSAVRRIAQFFVNDLKRINNRGSPLSVENQVAVALVQLSGGCFQRITGLATGISQNCARATAKRFVNVLVRRHKEFIRFPSADEMENTAFQMEQKYKLPGFAFGIDGCMIRFQKKPRFDGPGHNAQDFWGRKQFYCLNALILANDKLIYSVDVGHPGCSHDSRVWSNSEAKKFVESNASLHYMVAADSAFPLSVKLMKPYSIAEAGADASKRRFNSKLSGLRTEMTENVFGRLKQRFPILRELRYNLQYAQRTTLACCVLHNIAVFLEDEVPAEVDSADPHNRRLPFIENTPIAHEASLDIGNQNHGGSNDLEESADVSQSQTIRLAEGKLKRDRLRANLAR